MYTLNIVIEEIIFFLVFLCVCMYWISKQNVSPVDHCQKMFEKPGVRVSNTSMTFLHHGGQPPGHVEITSSFHSSLPEIDFRLQEE